MTHVATLPRRAKALLLMGSLSLMIGMTTAETPVADAAMRGDIEAVRSLLRSGADVNAAQGDGMTALHWAAQTGERELAEVLVYAGARLNAGTRIGRYTALHIAAREGSREVAQVLVEAGADPGATTSNSGATPLHLAARSGDAGLISLLIEHGADTDAQAGNWQQTPLTFAAALNRVEAIKTLLNAGADPNGTSAAVDVVEMAAADNAAEQRLQKALEGFREQQAGDADWQPTPSQVQAAVDLARQVQIRWSEISAEEEAVADSVSAEESESESESENAEEEDTQVESGSDETNSETSEEDPEASTGEAPAEGEAEEEEKEPRPMSYAEQVGSWGGLSPIHHAVRQGHLEATLALLSGGAQIDAVTGDNTTPLLMAAINGQWDLAKVLLDLGADPNLSSDAGATPLYAVLEREWQPRASYAHPTEHQHQETTHLEMMELFLEAGADPDARLTKHLWYMEYTFGVLRGSGINLKGATPFWRAAYALDLEAMKLLSSYGADPDLRTMKPPQRRRRAMPTEEDEGSESGQEPEALEGNSESEPGEDPSTESEAAATVEDEEDEETDDSGLPPIPTDGPAIHAIHAASGVGYGQSFAGNAHRYLPNGWLPAVKYLVEEMGADVNARDANGYAPIHHAASRGDVEMILYMVEKGADVMVVSRKGETTVDMANGPVQRVQPYPEAISLLESLGAVNNQNCVSCQ